MLPRALTIAGSDSGGGAGIQADLKTFSAMGVYGTSVITAVTAQNTMGVFGVEAISPRMISLQIEAVLSDIGADAIKIGMLHSEEAIEAVVSQLHIFRVKNVILDPVMVAKGGDPLLKPEAIHALKRLAIPLAQMITPNIPEAQVLLKRKIQSQKDMEEAARQLLDLGAKSVLLKGGHLDGPESRDCLAIAESIHWFSAPRIQTRNDHGTGCTLSSAIAAQLALGRDLIEATSQGKKYLSAALASGAQRDLGKGHGPIDHSVDHSVPLRHWVIN
ncbi:MAG: bifunctional hydroxymethylpyrimidine kinase/phosphomethylpyrimidine kinase [Bdellovibrionaceae bacterium]|nr:bifunctional hydroxymethylpyrimidine kinase/phosphomethylpyrimidine kinase [Pseudobdellovibrionaceae bacterium]